MIKDNKTETVKKVTLLGAIVNLLLAASKITIGKLTGMSALVADGVHSLSDLISDCFIYFFANHWSQPADKDHPYGHGRFETIISAFLALSLFFVSLGLIYSALTVDKSSNPASLGYEAISIAAIGIVVKEWLFRWTLKKGVEVDSMALKANAHHHRSDALSSLPVVVAVVVQWFYPSFTLVDTIATIIVSLMITKAAYDIAIPIFFELTEKQISPDIARKIQILALATNDIKEVHHIRSRRLGGDIVIDLHILVDGSITVSEGHNIAEKFKDEILFRISTTKDVLIHVEPFTCSERVIYPCCMK